MLRNRRDEPGSGTRSWPPRSGSAQLEAAFEGHRADGAAGRADGVRAQHVAAERPEHTAALVPDHAVCRSQLVAGELLAGRIEHHDPVAGTCRRHRGGRGDAAAGQHLDRVRVGDARDERGAPGLTVDERHRATRRRDQDAAAAVDRLAVVGGAEQRAQVGGNLGTVGGAPRPHLAMRGRGPLAERQDEDLIPSADDQLALPRRLSSHGGVTRQRHDHQPA